MEPGGQSQVEQSGARRVEPGGSLVDVPDLGEQRGQLLVLQPQGEHLLRVHGAQGPQAHQLHQHAGEHQVVLSR